MPKMAVLVKRLFVFVVAKNPDGSDRFCMGQCMGQFWIFGSGSKKVSSLWLKTLGITGRGGGIRTRDPLHPMQVRYQAAPRPDEARIISEACCYEAGLNAGAHLIWLHLRASLRAPCLLRHLKTSACRNHRKTRAGKWFLSA